MLETPVVANWKPIAGAAILLFGAGFWAGTCGRATNEELDTAHDSTIIAVARAEVAEDARAEIEIRSREAIRIHEASRDSALDALSAAYVARPVIEDRITEREAPADTAAFRRGFRAGRDSTTLYEVRPLLAARIAQDSAYAAQGRLLTAERDARQTAQAGLRAALEEAGLLRDARPSWFARQASRAAWIATGYVAGRYVVPAISEALASR